MASLDEERKRAELAYLNQIAAASNLDQRSIDDLRQADELAATQVPQEEIRNNFFTRRGDNQALNLLRGIVGQRLISRGLIEDPADIARRNLLARQNRGSQIDNLSSLAQLRSSLADDTRAQAFADATLAGVNANPLLSLSPEQLVQNRITAGGFDFNPQQALDLAQDRDSVTRFTAQRALLPSLVQRGVITQQQSDLFQTQEPEELNESLTNLRVDAEGGEFLPGDQVNPITRQAFLSDAYSPEDRKQVRLFGRELTNPETIANDSYGKIHEEYRRSGRFIDAQNVADLTKVVNYLIEADDEGFRFFTGPIAGKIPDAARAFYDEGRKSLDTRAALRNVVQKTFREILGGQFAFLEGERLIQNAYDENLPPEYNLIRVRRLLFQAQEIAKAGAERAAHFDKYGTLFGADEKQLDSGLDGLVASVTDATIAERGLYSLFSRDEREAMFNSLIRDGSPEALKELEELKQWEADNR